MWSENINTSTYWDSIYTNEKDKNWRQYPNTFQRIVSIVQSSDSVLDVGCGLGVLLEILKPKCKYVAGLDISPVAIETLREKGIDGKVGNLPAIDCLDKSFDVVTATEIMEHLDDVPMFLSEVCRVARNLVIITVPNNTLKPEELAEHRASYTKTSLREVLVPFFDSVFIEAFIDDFTAAGQDIAIPTLLAVGKVKVLYPKFKEKEVCVAIQA